MATKTKTTAAQLEKKVRVALVDLEKEGKRPTYGNVRDKIGGGSFRDLGPIIKAVLAEQEARAKAESEVPDMPEDVAELATALWEGAYRCADAVAGAERRAHAEEMKRLQDEIKEREDDVTKAEDALDDMTARAEAATEVNSKLEQQLVDLRVIIAGLEGRLMGRQEAAPEGDKGRKKAAPDPEEDLQISLFDEPAEDEDHWPSALNSDADGQDDNDEGGLGDEAA